MNNTKKMKTIYFELCSVPDSEGLVLELATFKNNEPLIEIRVDDNDVQWIRFFSNTEHVAIKLKDMEKAIDIAKREVVNIDS